VVWGDTWAGRPEWYLP